MTGIPMRRIQIVLLIRAGDAVAEHMEGKAGVHTTIRGIWNKSSFKMFNFFPFLDILRHIQVKFLQAYLNHIHSSCLGRFSYDRSDRSVHDEQQWVNNYQEKNIQRFKKIFFANLRSSRFFSLKDSQILAGKSWTIRDLLSAAMSRLVNCTHSLNPSLTTCRWRRNRYDNNRTRATTVGSSKTFPGKIVQLFSLNNPNLFKI